MPISSLSHSSQILTLNAFISEESSRDKEGGSIWYMSAKIEVAICVHISTQGPTNGFPQERELPLFPPRCPLPFASKWA